MMDRRKSNAIPAGDNEMPPDSTIEIAHGAYAFTIKSDHPDIVSKLSTVRHGVEATQDGYRVTRRPEPLVSPEAWYANAGLWEAAVWEATCQGLRIELSTSRS